MKIRRFFGRHAHDPMGALNDLSFLLIIYFLVIAGFNTNRGFLLNLPRKDQPRVVQQEDLLRLNLRGAQGRLVSVASETGEELVLDDEALGTLLGESLGSHPNITVLLTIDGEVPYQRFVDVIHTIRGHRVENFSFTRSSSGGSAVSGAP